MDFMGVNAQYITEAQAFKKSWECAGSDGSVSPQLAKAWIEELHIHPERVQHYADALLKYKAGHIKKLDPADFKEAVVVPIRTKVAGLNKG